MPFTRYVPQWNGFTGAPGFTVLNAVGALSTIDAQIFANEVHDFFADIANRIPDIASILFPGEATVHADDGTLTGALAIVPPLEVNCTGLGSFAAPVGARVTWETGSIVAGRRIRGRSFLVPMISSMFDTDGTLTSANRTQVVNAAAGLINGLAAAGLSLAVWSPTTSTVSPVTSGVVPDQATVLRSRRD